MSKKRDSFGTRPPGVLLKEQAIPASIGILVMSIYSIIDTIFVGLFVGSNGIAAITVVMPITFLIAGLGMAIGVGGGSIISRAFGRGDETLAARVFGNQMLLTLSLSTFFTVIGYFLLEPVLLLFGGKGEVLEPASTYFFIILPSVPFLAWAMMSNNVIRAEGFPRLAMVTLIVPAVANLVLDPLLIIVFDMGIAGAAYATLASYVGAALFTIWFFVKGPSQLHFNFSCLKPVKSILGEISSLGSVTFVRQSTISVLAIVLNNSLFSYGGEQALAVYGIINRLMLFANFPVLGITQGFIPLVGYNYGAQLFERVKTFIKLSISSATIVAFLIFSLVMIFTPQIVSVFTNDDELIDVSVPAVRLSFIAMPLIAVNFIGGAYYQAIGHTWPAMILSLSKQGFFLIPLILTLPLYLGLNGIWVAFPAADLLSGLLTVVLGKTLGLKFQSAHSN